MLCDVNAGCGLPEMVYYAFYQAFYGNLLLLAIIILLAEAIILWKFKIPAAGSFMVGMITVFVLAWFFAGPFLTIMALGIIITVVLLAFMFLKMGGKI